MFDKLVQIPYSDLPRLRDLYKKNWPKHLIGYQTINNYYKWFKQDPNISDIHMYSLNGDWSDGSYLLLDLDFLLINTCSDNHDKIPILLSLVDWSKEWDMFAYKGELFNEVQTFINLHNLKIKRHSETIWHYLSKEEAIKFDVSVPDGYKIKPLNEENIKTICSFWPYSKCTTDMYFKRLIKYNPSAGIFTDTGDIIAWILRTQIGTLGMLHIVDEYQRRGFGSLLVKSLGKSVAENGDDINVTIVPTNLPSRNMFKKLGFKESTKIYWSEMI